MVRTLPPADKWQLIPAMTTNDTLFSAKQALRRQMRERLKTMSMEEAASLSVRLVRWLTKADVLELSKPFPSPQPSSSGRGGLYSGQQSSSTQLVELSLGQRPSSDEPAIPLSPGERVGVRGEASLSHNTMLPAGSTIALFGGIMGEPDLLPLIPWLIKRGCTPVFFGFADGQLVAKAVRSVDDLERGVFGVWVPKEEMPMVDAAALNVIFTPGLAFDTAGHRLGRGRGYYDRLFANPQVKARRIALGFDLQMVDAVPVAAHDATMHAVITETGVKVQN